MRFRVLFAGAHGISAFQGSGALGEDVGRLKYVSGAREEALRRLGIETVGDLLTHIPRRYLDFTHALD